jgi:hypothetical protein
VGIQRLIVNLVMGKLEVRLQALDVDVVGLLKRIELHGSIGIEEVLEAAEMVKNDPVEEHIPNSWLDHKGGGPSHDAKHVPDNCTVVAIKSL